VGRVGGREKRRAKQGRRRASKSGERKGLKTGGLFGGSPLGGKIKWGGKNWEEKAGAACGAYPGEGGQTLIANGWRGGIGKVKGLGQGDNLHLGKEGGRAVL